jgi:ribonuclease BN (tRNA processing enzyme)
MEIIFLGTNGWYDTDTGNTTCTLIKSAHHQILLDAGNGIYKADRYVDSDRPVHLFLSHFHLDHIVGLHTLNKFRFKKGLQIYGQPETEALLDRVVNEPFTVPLGKLPFKAEVHELPEGRHSVPFAVECRYLVHASRCMGYRLELEGKIIAYCPDTGFCDNAVELARDADLLITECSLRPGEVSPDWPHLNPSDAVRIARLSGAKRLALTHFDANRYQSMQNRMDARASVSDFKDLTIGRDGMALYL